MDNQVQELENQILPEEQDYWKRDVISISKGIKNRLQNVRRKLEHERNEDLSDLQVLDEILDGALEHLENVFRLTPKRFQKRV